MVVGGAVSAQFGSALAVQLMGRVGPVGAVALRLILATVLVLLFVRLKLRAHSRSDLLLGIGFGLALGVMNLCFYEAAARLPLGAAVTLEFLGPLGLAVATSRRWRDAAWVVLAGLGVYLLYAGGLERLSLTGVAFALGSALCWAVYILLGSRASRRFPGAASLAIALTVASIVIAPFAFFTTGTALLHWDVIGIGFGVAFLSSALPYSLDLGVLRRLPARVFGVLMSLEPTVAAIAGYLVLHQRLSGWQILAIILVVIASAGATLASST